MGLLILLAIMFFIGMLLKNAEKAASEHHKKFIENMKEDIRKTAPDKNCPPHKWTHHPVTEKLTCTLCNLVAGSINTDHGEY